MIDFQDLTPFERLALAHLQREGRVKTSNDMQRLPMIALKAMGLADDAFEDVWQLKRAPAPPTGGHLNGAGGGGILGRGRILRS